MLPQNPATKDAARSAKLGSATASASSSRTVRTLRRAISLALWRWEGSCGMRRVFAQAMPGLDGPARIAVSAVPAPGWAAGTAEALLGRGVPGLGHVDLRLVALLQQVVVGQR